MSDRSVQVLSVDEVLQRIRDDDWRFVVAQRSFEWDENRISNLVDSLLEGFPIGSLLIAEVDGPGYAAKAQDKGRRVVEGRRGSTEQLLDGQQRCLSLVAVFEEGIGFVDRHGVRKHLWIRIDGPNTERKPFHPKEGRRVRLHWSDRDDLVNLDADARKVERLTVAQASPGWIRLAVLAGLCRSNAQAPRIAREAGLEEPTDDHLQYIRWLKQRIRAVLGEPSIPVHRWARVHGPQGVERLHHAFVRLNTGGKPLRAEDQFFAGVKLYWEHAEEGIQPLVDHSHGLLNHRDALVLVARIAQRRLDPEGQKDCYPLQLQHLSAQRGKTGSARKNQLVDEMKRLVVRERRLSKRLAGATDAVCAHLIAQFAGGAAHIGAPQVTACIAWAFQHKAQPSLFAAEDLDQLARFAFWTSAFNCHAYGRGPFGRRVMHWAWHMGQKGQALPTDHTTFHRRCYDYRFVVDELWKPESTCFVQPGDSSAPGNATQLIRRNRPLFLKSFQRIQMGQHIEWDHILPFARARRMFGHDQGTGTDPMYLQWISAPGNFSGIDMKANRQLGDSHLQEKFRDPTGPNDKTYLNVEGFTLTDPQVTEAERALLMQIYACRDNKAEAGPLFVQFVVHRTERIWADAVRRAGPPPAPLPAANRAPVS